jgi:hypothetical protein
MDVRARLKNAVIFHARTEYQGWDEPQQKRHLLRLWLTNPRFKDEERGCAKVYELSRQTNRDC